MSFFQQPVSSVNPCSVTVIVPTYREVENLRPLLIRLSAAMSTMKRSYEVIVVDDNSRDGTDQAIGELNAAGYPVRLITRVDERDLSSAVIRGFSEARGDVLICMDADLSHPPEAIPKLVECLADPCIDFALGSRYVPGGSTDRSWGTLHWLNSKIATLLARPFTSVKDPMSGFFAIPRTVYHKAASLDPVGYKIALELIVKCDCAAIREVPIHFGQRRFGKSKSSLAERLKYLRHLSRLLHFKFKFLTSNHSSHRSGDLNSANWKFRSNGRQTSQQISSEGRFAGPNRGDLRRPVK
jgi:dolichol-phosphate mannosyltransferase